MSESFVLETQAQTLKRIEDMMIDKLGIKIVSCDYFGKSLIKPKNTIEHCFAHKEQPLDLIASISKEMKEASEPFMNWRQDLGSWTSIYNLKSSNYGILISLNTVDPTETLERKLAYKEFGSVGQLIIGRRSK
jgi:hypothetical protein